VRVHPWSESTVASIATECDLALIPLPLDRALERGKPESKLISFWRMGLPVVTSATPAYVRVMAAAGQTLACRTEHDWREAVLGLIADDAARRRAGQEGRAFAEQEYGEDRLLTAWDAVFESLAPRARI
jgi:glycosyltransferase involved in cell wall biosynthesis